MAKINQSIVFFVILVTALCVKQTTAVSDVNNIELVLPENCELPTSVEWWYNNGDGITQEDIDRYEKKYCAEKPKRFCWILTDGYYWWCEPEFAVYSAHGYKVFDASWLKVQQNGNPAQQANADAWIAWILDAQSKNRG